MSNKKHALLKMHHSVVSEGDYLVQILDAQTLKPLWSRLLDDGANTLPVAIAFMELAWEAGYTVFDFDDYPPDEAA